MHPHSSSKGRIRMASNQADVDVAFGPKTETKSGREEDQSAAQRDHSDMKPLFVEIAANLLDEQYQGRYNEGKQYHPPDLDAVLRRAWDAGVDRIIITAGNLLESRMALEMARRDPRLFSTVGVHPTRCHEFEDYKEGAEEYMNELEVVMVEGRREGKVVAVGECGLDYDRLHFCDKEIQKKWFERQFALAKKSGLPMFLHLRAATTDFLDIIRRQQENFSAGVVHSFDGSYQDLRDVLEIPTLDIGINGCSLKKRDNIIVAASVPIERLHLETDCPWCDIRPSHAGSTAIQKAPMKVIPAKDRKKHDPECLVKGRNEPCNVYAIAEVVSSARVTFGGSVDYDRGVVKKARDDDDSMPLVVPTDEQVKALADQVYKNSMRMFFSSTE